MNKTVTGKKQNIFKKITKRTPKKSRLMNDVSNNLDAKKENHAPEVNSSITIRRLLDWYKECLAIAKDTLDVVLKFIPICLFFPAVLLWNYLHKIGWDILFSDAVVSVPGFIVMIVSSCILIFAIFLQFCVPSMLAAPAANLFEGKSEHLKIIAGLHLLPPFIWFTAITFLAVVFDLSAWLVSVGSIFLTVATAISCVFIFRSRLLPIRDKSNDYPLRTWIAIPLLAFCPTVAAIATSAPLLLCLNLVNGATFSRWSAPVIFWLCGLGSMLGLAPGVAFLLAKVSGKSTAMVWRATGLMTVLVGYVVLSTTLYFSPVSSVILRIAGVVDRQPRVYQLLKPDLLPAMRAVGIFVAATKPSSFNGQQTTYFISAFSRFSFNNVELLCSRPFDIENANASTWSNANVEQTRLRSLEGGDFCVKVHSDDLRPLRRTHRNEQQLNRKPAT